jgi:hypothetical protein
MRLLVALCLFCLPITILAQQDENFPKTDSIYKTIFLDGVFETKEDFIKGRRKNYEVYPKTSRKDERYKSGPVADPGNTVVFRYKSNDKIVHHVFAITYNGFLYFDAGAIVEDANRKDRFQGGGRNFDFIRALIGGQNYIYAESDFADAFEMGVVMQAGGTHTDLLRNKGFVWDFWKHEFNIFRQCKDFNAFITDKYPQGVQNCNEGLNILEVRKSIEKIK